MYVFQLVFPYHGEGNQHEDQLSLQVHHLTELQVLEPRVQRDAEVQNLKQNFLLFFRKRNFELLEVVKS